MAVLGVVAIIVLGVALLGARDAGKVAIGAIVGPVLVLVLGLASCGSMSLGGILLFARATTERTESPNEPPIWLELGMLLVPPVLMGLGLAAWAADEKRAEKRLAQREAMARQPDDLTCGRCGRFVSRAEAECPGCGAPKERVAPPNPTTATGAATGVDPSAGVAACVVLGLLGLGAGGPIGAGLGVALGVGLLVAEAHWRRGPAQQPSDQAGKPGRGSRRSERSRQRRPHAEPELPLLALAEADRLESAPREAGDVDIPAHAIRTAVPQPGWCPRCGTLPSGTQNCPRCATTHGTPGGTVPAPALRFAGRLVPTPATAARDDWAEKWRRWNEQRERDRAAAPPPARATTRERLLARARQILGTASEEPRSAEFRYVDDDAPPEA